MVDAMRTVVCSIILIGFLFAPIIGCRTASSDMTIPLGSSADRMITRDTTSEPSNPVIGSGGITVKREYQSGLEYRIGPEDVLRISVWNNKELSLDLMVRPDGKISFPLIQDVQAEGLTPIELSNVIHTKLLDFIKDPHVSVIVLQVNAPKYFIVGAVNKPGTYPLRGDISVLQALSIAGGFTPFASIKNIRLVRNLGGKQEVRVINYYKVIEDRSNLNYLIRPGDTIVVP